MSAAAARSGSRAGHDRGFALLAAVLGIAGFAALAVMILAVDRRALIDVRADAERARLEAAADAGMMIALHALGENAGPARWPIDGAVQHADFDGIALAIRIEDERGKAPLDNLDRDQARALFAAAGARGERLTALTEEFTDWQLDDADVGSGGVTSADYAALPFSPRHGQFRTIGELMALKDMDRATFGRLAGSVTVFFGQSGPFDPADASPVALAAVAPSAAASGLGTGPFALDTLRLDNTAGPSLIGRPLTVKVVATDAGARAEKTAIVELTGASDRPFWIRYAAAGVNP